MLIVPLPHHSSYKNLPFCTTSWRALLVVRSDAASFMNHLITLIRSERLNPELSSQQVSQQKASLLRGVFVLPRRMSSFAVATCAPEKGAPLGQGVDLVYCGLNAQKGASLVIQQ